MPGVSYCTVGTNDFEKAKVFYGAVLAVIGMKPKFVMERGCMFANPEGGMFTVLLPLDGKPATVGNGVTVGFSLESTAQVDAFHAKALEMGGVCEGKPGERGPGVYFGYFRDLDGNKLCGYKWD